MTATTAAGRVKCPKCGGRTILDDVHTYVGHETERRCINCGFRTTGEILTATVEAAGEEPLTVKEAAEPTGQVEEERQMAKRGKCAGPCGREDQVLVGQGLCWKCRKQAIDAGTYSVRTARDIKVASTAAVPSPPPVPAGDNPPVGTAAVASFFSLLRSPEIPPHCLLLDFTGREQLLDQVRSISLDPSADIIKLIQALLAGDLCAVREGLFDDRA